jgi:hypothetical protein
MNNKPLESAAHNENSDTVLRARNECCEKGFQNIRDSFSFSPDKFAGAHSLVVNEGKDEEGNPVIWVEFGAEASVATAATSKIPEIANFVKKVSDLPLVLCDLIKVKFRVLPCMSHSLLAQRMYSARGPQDDVELLKC